MCKEKDANHFGSLCVTSRAAPNSSHHFFEFSIVNFSRAVSIGLSYEFLDIDCQPEIL